VAREDFIHSERVTTRFSARRANDANDDANDDVSRERARDTWDADERGERFQARTRDGGTTRGGGGVARERRDDAREERW
jgi:hypothetical protein